MLVSLLGFGAVVSRSLAGIIGVFFLSLFFVWKSFVSGGDFCLVRNSGSLHDVVALRDESGFAWSSVSFGSQGSLRVVVSP